MKKASRNESGPHKIYEQFCILSRKTIKSKMKHVLFLESFITHLQPLSTLCKRQPSYSLDIENQSTRIPSTTGQEDYPSR